MWLSALTHNSIKLKYWLGNGINAICTQNNVPVLASKTGMNSLSPTCHCAGTVAPSSTTAGGSLREPSLVQSGGRYEFKRQANSISLGWRRGTGWTSPFRYKVSDRTFLYSSLILTLSICFFYRFEFSLRFKHNPSDVPCVFSSGYF